MVGSVGSTGESNRPRIYARIKKHSGVRCRASDGSKRQNPRLVGGGFDGGAEGNRTPDLLNAIQALSQLSYGPNFLVMEFIQLQHSLVV